MSRKFEVFAVAVIVAAVLATGTKPMGHWYASSLPVKGIERSPFDSFMVKTFLSPDEQASLSGAFDVTEGTKAINKGATVREAMAIGEDSNQDASNQSLVRDWTRVPVSMWAICSTEDVMVCLVVPSDSSIIYLSGIKTVEDQDCKTSVSYAGVVLAPIETFIYNGNLSYYVPKTKTGKNAILAIRNMQSFSVSYACLNTSATYNFKAPQPLKNREVPR
jgi:hypothetical protein